MYTLFWDTLCIGGMGLVEKIGSDGDWGSGEICPNNSNSNNNNQGKINYTVFGGENNPSKHHHQDFCPDLAMATHLRPFLKPVDCCQHLTELTFGVPMFLTVWIKNYLLLHFLNSLACDTLLCSFIRGNCSVLHISHVHRCEKITTSMPRRR